MEHFFGKPTPQKIAEYIHHQVLAVHETGGRGYRYLIPAGLSISFVNDVIDRLSEYLLDAEVIELNSGYIVIDWS
jgi:hypothetical protein